MGQLTIRLNFLANMLDRHMPLRHIVWIAEVVGSEEFEKWFESLDDADVDAVARVVNMLELQGTTLPFPYSSAIKGSRVALRELRVQSHGHPFRVFYAFDPIRQAELLIAGDKTGRKRFYEEMIPRAERIFARYLQELER